MTKPANTVPHCYACNAPGLLMRRIPDSAYRRDRWICLKCSEEESAGENIWKYTLGAFLSFVAVIGLIAIALPLAFWLRGLF